MVKVRERRTEAPLIGRDVELSRLTALAADPAVGAVLLTGPAGVGKSRLAEGAMAELVATGWRGFGLSATAAGARIPYAALSELIPDTLDGLDEQPDPSGERQVLRAVEDALGVDGPEPIVLAIDDIASIDLPSCELLVHLATNRRLFILATQALDPALPEALRRLTPAAVVELDVEPFTVSGTAALAAEIVGGTVGPGLVRTLQSRTRGNPFFIVELVNRGLNDGDISERHGVHHLQGDLTVGPSLGRQIVFRLGLLSPVEKEVLELLALAGALGVDDLAALAGPETVEVMEQRGLLTTWTDGRRLRAGLCHPLHGDALQADMTPLVLRRRHRELAGVLDRHGRRRAEDTVLHARAAAAGGHDVPTDALLEAVYIALRLDRVRDAAELARAAFAAEPTEVGRNAWAETLIRMGRFVEADELLAEPLAPGAGEWAILRRAIRRASNQLWGFNDPDAARRIDAECLAGLTEPDAVNRVIAHQAWIDYCDGASDRALELTEPLIDTDHADVRFAMCAARAPALVLRGRVDDGADLAQRAWDSGWGADTEYGSHGQHLIALGFASLYTGDLPGARFIAEQAIGFCRDNSENTPLLFFLELAAWTELLAGELTTAISYFEEAFALATDLAIALATRSALAGATVARAQRGEEVETAATLARIDGIPEMPGPRWGTEVALAEAWTEVATGDPSAGAQRLRDAAAATAERRLSTLTLLLLLDVARLGYATKADVETAEVALQGAQGAFLPLLGDAVRAAATDDPQALDRVAVRFDELGFTLWAAEFGARAADRWSAAGDQRAATASERVAVRAREQVGEARTAALARSRSVDPLTRRQREIASLVAGGHRNSDIAERLHVSVRTVETHLRAIYRKVGVANRRELTSLIDGGGLDETP